jgi:DNA polymerase-1
MSLMTFHDKFWNTSCQVIAEMEARGVTLDVDYLQHKRELALEEVNELERKLDAWAYDYSRQTECPVNWASPTQLAAFLYHYKCYPISPVKGSLNATKRNTKREETTSEAALDWIARNAKSDTDREYLEILLRARKTAKLAQFMESLCSMVSVDGRLRSSFGPNTDTGRLSSSNPNMQNVPVRSDRFGIRKAFVSAPGKLLIVADYSQLEMYVLAHFLIHELDDHSLANDLSSGDVHSAMAFRIWPDELRALGATPDNIKEVAKSYRGNAKTVNYAVPYGKTASGLGSQIKGSDGKGIGKKAAQGILDDYFEACPGLDELFEALEEHCSSYRIHAYAAWSHPPASRCCIGEPMGTLGCRAQSS